MNTNRLKKTAAYSVVVALIATNCLSVAFGCWSVQTDGTGERNFCNPNAPEGGSTQNLYTPDPIHGSTGTLNYFSDTSDNYVPNQIEQFIFTGNLRCTTPYSSYVPWTTLPDSPVDDIQQGSCGC